MRPRTLAGIIGVVFVCVGVIFTCETGRAAPGNQFLFQWGSNGTGDGQFQDPGAIAVNGTGHIYVVDANNHRIQVFTPAGQFLFKWGSAGSGDGQFMSLCGIAINSTGCVYVVDSNNCSVQVFSPTGQFLFKWGSAGSGDGQFDNIDGPVAIAINNTGCVYVVDPGNSRVQVFSPTGQFLFKWGSYGSGEGQFGLSTEPRGIAINTTGHVYVIGGGCRLQVFTQMGQFEFAWGSDIGVCGSGSYIALNLTGSIYITNGFSGSVQIFNQTGEKVFSQGFGIQGEGYSQPGAVAVNGTGCMYICDTYNDCMWVCELVDGFDWNEWIREFFPYIIISFVFVVLIGIFIHYRRNRGIQSESEPNKLDTEQEKSDNGVSHQDISPRHEPPIFARYLDTPSPRSGPVSEVLEIEDQERHVASLIKESPRLQRTKQLPTQQSLLDRDISEKILMTLPATIKATIEATLGSLQDLRGSIKFL